MPSDHIKRYPCKVQWGRWFYVDAILSLCLYAYFLISAWVYGSVLILVLALSMIAVRLAMFSMFTNLSYELDDTHLIFRNGLLRNRMLLSEVHEILPSKKPLKLLVIYSKFRQRMDIPSPQDRDAFLDDFASRPGFNRDGDRVMRRENQLAECH